MSIDEFWTEYLIKNNLDLNTTCNIIKFSDENDDLLNLAKQGNMRARTSLFTNYDKYNMPKENDIYLVVDVLDNPKFIIENTKVRIVIFKNVDYDLAKLEGIDKNLAAWQIRKMKEFEDELKKENKKFEVDMKVVFEEFEIIYEKD